MSRKSGSVEGVKFQVLSSIEWSLLTTRHISKEGRVDSMWFDGQAEEAARFYVSLLPDSRIERVMRSPADTPSGPAGCGRGSWGNGERR